MLKEYITQVMAGQDLSPVQAQAAMQVIMSGQAGDVQISALLTALKIKGETSGEITGFARTMREFAEKISCGSRQLIDTCGTGGDKKGTFNVSTTVAFVLAGAGLTVAKHGNSGVSSSCGSADVLKALGIEIDLPAVKAEEMIKTLGIGFLYAPVFHKAMKYAAAPRRELGFRTIFNLLGPLTNPANASCQLIGVYEAALTEKIAAALQGLGVRRAMVVHSFDGMDEISTLAPTHVTEVRHDECRSYIINPRDYGLGNGQPEDYLGGTPAENAVLIEGILAGMTGPKRDIVLLNAAAALMVADKADTIPDGLAAAAESIDSGAALSKLQALREASRAAREGFLFM